MSAWSLPRSYEVDGLSFEIRTDYRAILDILEVMGDPDLDERERGYIVLSVFYPGFDSMERRHHEGALKYMYWFINGGDDEREQKRPSPRMMDWVQDFPIIVHPVNRVLGQEIRGADYLHWWTFLSAYYEIGDCLFAQVVSIRRKKAKGVKLDKSDREFYQKNKHLVDFKARKSEKEAKVVSEWIV